MWKYCSHYCLSEPISLQVPFLAKARFGICGINHLEYSKVYIFHILICQNDTWKTRLDVMIKITAFDTIRSDRWSRERAEREHDLLFRNNCTFRLNVELESLSKFIHSGKMQELD